MSESKENTGVRDDDQSSNRLTREDYIHALDTLITILNECTGYSYPNECATAIYNRETDSELAILAADELSRLQIETRDSVAPHILISDFEQIMLVYTGDYLSEIMRLHTMLREISPALRAEFDEAFAVRVGEIHYIH